MNYTFDDLVSAFQQLGLKSGDTISLKTGLRSLGEMETHGQDPLELYVEALDKVLDFDRGTVVVASTSTNLCNTNIPFSLSDTPGTMGKLTEKIRGLDGAIRSYHAFESYSAYGGNASQFMEGLSRHAYGVDTPEDRLIGSNALCVSIGLPANVTCSVVHHIEMLAAVPYRYVKEYNHPVAMTDGTVELDKFYRHPWYINSDIKKSYKRFFSELSSSGFEIHRVPLGNGEIQAYKLADIYRIGMRVLKRNIYAVLESEPAIKPWIE